MNDEKLFKMVMVFFYISLITFLIYAGIMNYNTTQLMIQSREEWLMAYHDSICNQLAIQSEEGLLIVYYKSICNDVGVFTPNNNQNGKTRTI